MFGNMTTMVIQIENSSVLSGLKKVLNAMEGVTILKSTKTTSTPNSATIKAIKDVKAGRTNKATSVDDLISQCLD